jgi:ribonucleoside-diphosphate reductase alpha chain
MPPETTPEDIANAYLWGWKLGLKALAIYRDGSKWSQPLSTTTEGKRSAKDETPAARPKRERLPDTRSSLTHKFSVGGHEGYINVGLYPDGRPGELFITMAKEGSTVGGLMDAFGTAISICLQYGVPLEVLVNKFSHTRFEPMGHTSNPDIRLAKSVVDYIFRWLGITFLPGYREASRGLSPAEVDSAKGEATAQQIQVNGNGAAATMATHAVGPNGRVDWDLLDRAGVALKLDPSRRDQQFARFQSDAPSCDNCGAITVRNGNCYLCHNCGNSMGCS